MALDFSQRFSSTPRGARLARRLAQAQLDLWGVPYGCPLSDDVVLVVAELAANAVLHGRVAGRDFELRMAYDGQRAVRVMVSDTCGDRVPPDGPAPAVPWVAEGGRGLTVVRALSRGWGVSPRVPGKTVWAECALEASECIPGSAGRDLEDIPGSNDSPGVERRRGT